MRREKYKDRDRAEKNGHWRCSLNKRPETYNGHIYGADATPWAKRNERRRERKALKQRLGLEDYGEGLEEDAPLPAL